MLVEVLHRFPERITAAASARPWLRSLDVTDEKHIEYLLREEEYAQRLTRHIPMLKTRTKVLLGTASSPHRLSFGFCTLLIFHPRSTPEGGRNAERNPYRLVYNLEQWLDFDATHRILVSHTIPTECILSWLVRIHLSKRLLLL